MFSWRAIIIGATVAVSAWFALGVFLPGFFTEDSRDLSSITVYDAIGAVAYLIGGFVTGRIAGRWGGLNGLVMVPIGLVLTMVVWIVVAISASSLGLLGESSPVNATRPVVTVEVWLAFFISLLLSFLGGYLGGKLGEWLQLGSE